MNDIYDRVMTSIFTSLGFSLAKVNLDQETHEMDLDFYVAKKNNGDYFVYLNLHLELLPLVNNEIQIKISDVLEKGMEGAVKVFGDEINISKSFNKDSTLIIFSSYDDCLSSKVLNNIISIEEDPYFFKKQVVTVNSSYNKYLEISLDDHPDDYIVYLQTIISDTNKFNEFMEAKSYNNEELASEYLFVTKLYEKLPFLSLPVQEHRSDDLQKIINNKLSDSQFKFSEHLFSLDEKSVDTWITEVEEENLDD